MESFLHITDFNSYLNHTMLIRWGEEHIMSAEIVEVKKVVSHTTIDREPFSIVLRTAQRKEYFNQGICTLVHPEKGDLELFLVPLGFDEEGMRYEAVFA